MVEIKGILDKIDLLGREIESIRRLLDLTIDISNKLGIISRQIREISQDAQAGIEIIEQIRKRNLEASK